MHRLERYDTIIKSDLASKSFFFLNKQSAFSLISLAAGLYKAASITPEHALIFNILCGALGVPRLQVHGKKRKTTLSLSTQLVKKNKWIIFDKLVNELLPRINDFYSLKFHKPESSNFTLRLKQKFTPLTDFEELVNLNMYNTHKGIFLPLTVHFNLVNTGYHQVNEQYLRMLKLPFIFYVKRPAPALDDFVIT